jgi:hypothetical protein
MMLTSKNLRLILIGSLVALTVAFFAITIFGLSVLSSKSQSLVNLKAQSQTAYAQLFNLVQSKKDVEKYAYFKTVAQTVIPNDKNQAQAVLEINQMANNSGIAIQSITFPASTLGLGVNALSSTASATNAAASTSAQSALTQAKPVPGTPGLYSLELTITPEAGKDVPLAQQVTYPKMLDFLQRIENNRHTAQISQVSISPASDSTSLSFTLVINIFIKP